MSMGWVAGLILTGYLGRFWIWFTDNCGPVLVMKAVAFECNVSFNELASWFSPLSILQIVKLKNCYIHDLFITSVVQGSATTSHFVNYSIEKSDMCRAEQLLVRLPWRCWYSGLCKKIANDFADSQTFQPEQLWSQMFSLTVSSLSPHG